MGIVAETAKILWVAVALLIGGGLVWLVTMRDAGLAVVPHYVGLIACSVGLVALMHRSVGLLRPQWSPRRFFRFTAPVGALLAVLIYAPFDRYHTEWTSVWDPQELTWKQTVRIPSDPLANNRWNLYTDTYTRWTGRHIYREIACVGPKSDMSLWHFMKGPMSPSGSPHGQWTVTYPWGPPREENWWMWYGEKITEGEWHLRNK